MSDRRRENIVILAPTYQGALLVADEVGVERRSFIHAWTDPSRVLGLLIDKLYIASETEITNASWELEQIARERCMRAGGVVEYVRT